MKRRRKARRKASGLIVTASDLLGVLREQSHAVARMREDVIALRLDIRLLRQDFLARLPDATTHEPATPGDLRNPPLVSAGEKAK